MSEKIAKKRRINVSTGIFAMLCCMTFLMYVDRTNIAVVAPYLRNELNLTNTNLGFVFSSFAVAYACFGIPGGFLTDKIGGRRGLTIFGLIWSVATIATGFTNSALGLAIGWFFVGLGEAPIYPTAARVIATWIPKERRGAAQGMMHASGRLANAVAPLLVSAIIVNFSWRWTFIGLGVITILFFAVFYSRVRDNPRTHPSISPEELASLGLVERKSERLIEKHEPVVWPVLLRRVWPATAACFCHGWVLWCFLNWIPSYFAHRYGVKVSESAVFASLVLLGGTLGTLMGGVLSDWRLKRTGNRLRSRREVMIFGYLSSIIGLLPILLTDNGLINAAGLGLAFFLSELTDSPLWLVGVEVSPQHAGTSSAMTFVGMALAGAVCPIVVGHLLDITNGNWSIAFGASIVVLLLGPVFTMLIKLDPSLDAADRAAKKQAQIEASAA